MNIRKLYHLLGEQWEEEGFSDLRRAESEKSLLISIKHLN